MFSYPNLPNLSPISQGLFGDTMSKKKWDKSINQLETEIKELSQKQKNLKMRLRGLKRLVDGKNIHIIKGNRQNRLKIIWGKKDYWFHLPQTEVGIDGGMVKKITSKFIDDILDGKIG